MYILWGMCEALGGNAFKEANLSVAKCLNGLVGLSGSLA